MRHISYAVALHENPRAGKTGGVFPTGQAYPPGSWVRAGSWKFLEDPVNEQAPIIKSQMEAEIMETLRTVVGPWRWIKGRF